MTLEGINWVAVAIAAGANVVLGYLWYGPFFGKAWLKALGKKEEEILSKLWRSIWLAIYTVLAAILITNIQNTTGLAFRGSQYWYFQTYLALPTLVNAIFEGRNLMLWGIKGTHHYIGLTVTSLILLSSKL